MSQRKAMRRTVTLAFAACAAWGAMPASSVAATQAQIDQARDRAAAWLLLNQNGDGFWTNNGGTDISVTSQALIGLTASNVKGFPVLNANAWLLNSKSESVDALSRVLLARALPAVSQAGGFQTLLGWKNADFGAADVRLWGAYPQYTTSFPDTALAWRAILTAGYELGSLQGPLIASLCNTLNMQPANGGWGVNIPPSSSSSNVPPAVAAGSVLATTQMVLMLNVARTKLLLGSSSCGFNVGAQVDSSIARSVDWLTTVMRNPDGGIGENGASSNISTALAFNTLQTVAPGNAATAALLDYMILGGRQRSDGSWSGDPLVTAVMLEALSRIATPAIADSDGDGLPDSIEVAMGTNPNVADARALANRSTGQARSGITLPIGVASNIPINVPFSGNVAVVGGTAPYAWAVTAGMLPPGLTLATTSAGTTSTISGMPSALGLYPFEYTVTDSTGATAKMLGQLTVVRALPGNGDVNGDGKVDLADVVMARRFTLGLAVPSPAQKAAADVAPVGEADGVIDAADLLRILRKALEIESF